MPRLSTETVGGGDTSWLGSDHGIFNGRTGILDVSTFTEATHFPNGYFPSGLPVAEVGGVLVPYDATEGTTTGDGVLAGHLLFDVKTDGTTDVAAALLDHGRVIAANLPISFSAPTAELKRAAVNIVYV